MPSTTAALTRTGEAIRAFQDADEADVAGVWHRSGLAGYTYLPMFQALTREIRSTRFEIRSRPRHSRDTRLASSSAASSQLACFGV